MTQQMIFVGPVMFTDRPTNDGRRLADLEVRDLTEDAMPVYDAVARQGQTDQDAWHEAVVVGLIVSTRWDRGELWALGWIDTDLEVGETFTVGADVTAFETQWVKGKPDEMTLHGSKLMAVRVTATPAFPDAVCTIIGGADGVEAILRART